MARHLVELIALILLPVGMFMVIYALYVFTWRAGNIAKKKVRALEDCRGPEPLPELKIKIFVCLSGMAGST